MVIKSRRIRWAGHFACMGQKRNTFSVLVGTPKGKTLFGRPRFKRKENIEMDLKGGGSEDGDWIQLAVDRE
jgi:hypothetical protein